MEEINRRLYSISTVCLLKHYNQDYLLHTLRTDFTGSNGVGKSMIADLFQVVFIADSKHIKFATEGIDKKRRRIETLPYESGIGYAFFNVEVTIGNYIIIGAAIFNQGNHLIKPFVVTSSINFEEDNLEQNTFTSGKLLFSQDFLKANQEPYKLDDLSRIIPQKYGLYLHYFSTREEKINYYAWLYKNELLPINLVKEGNLRAYAKVIQSFSKSKSLDIDSSKSLIEYLFEEDEIEIEQEYRQQELAIQKLLYQFKTTKYQISDIDNKQGDLLKLKNLENEKKQAEHMMDFISFVLAQRDRIKKQTDFDKADRDLRNKKIRLEIINPRSNKFCSLVNRVSVVSKREDKAFIDLAENQALFKNLKHLQEEALLINDFDINGLMQEVPKDKSNLLEKEARYYIDTIQKSRSVLKRYSSIKAMEEKRVSQDHWLKDRIRETDNKEAQLTSFQALLKKADNDSLFIKTISLQSSLTEPQLACLVYLRDVLLSKPIYASEGTRYTESINLIGELEITEDKYNKGWWIKTGQMQEFVPGTLSLLPNLSEVPFNNAGQLKKYFDTEVQKVEMRKNLYNGLFNGVKPEEFSEYDFDEDLSDNTKISAHKTAIFLCGLISDKKTDINNQQSKEIANLQESMQKYGITTDGNLEYEALLLKTKSRKKLFADRLDKLKSRFDSEQNEIINIQSNLPLLKENHNRLLIELQEAKKTLSDYEITYQTKYPERSLPDENFISATHQDIIELKEAHKDILGRYINEYNQIIGKYDETKDHMDIRVNEQVNNQNFSFDILEEALLGSKIRTLDEITSYLASLNTELLSITDELSKSLVKVFGKTEDYFDKYKGLIQSLNDFFRGKLISERFYFRIDFDPAPKLDIKWIEHLRKSAHGIASSGATTELSPQQFIEDFYIKFSGNKSRVTLEDLLNPKRYFILRGNLTDEQGKETSGSTGESYAAIALLGIARLSIVQDGTRLGLRFIILEESASLDNINFGMFPIIAKQYGYQIITMTPKPYSIGGDEGWYIHQLIPGKQNKDINYPKVMSYFRTNKSQMELRNFLIARQ